MNLQLVAEYDDALMALEAFANFAGRSWVEDPQLDHDRGTSAWITRWLHHPMTLLRVFDSIYARTTAALSEVTLEIALLREHLATNRGDSAGDEVLARRAADLLCHEADLQARVGRATQERILGARTLTLRILRTALGRVSFECARTNGPNEMARGSASGSPGEAYRRLVEEVRALAGVGDGVDWPPDLDAPLPGATAWRPGNASGISRAWAAAGSGRGLRSADRPAPRRP